MSAEHWFDALSRPHTRRTALKAALAGGLALTLPQLRATGARAAGNEPCYLPCIDAAKQQFANTYRDACGFAKESQQTAGVFGVIFGQPYVAAGTLYASFITKVACEAAAELTYRRDMANCTASQCGDPQHYPGGAKSAPAQAECKFPVEEKPCGPDFCCETAKSDCVHCSNGEYRCCRKGTNCCPGANA